MRVLRRGGVGAAVVCAVLLSAAPAWAHITITPDSAPRGGTADLTFNVPNESDSAGTTTVEIDFPTDHPIATVSVEPVAGWTFDVSNETLAKPIQTDDGPVSQVVSKIVWTGGSIKPGEFQEFVIVADGLPTDTGQLVFKALQTYSDGTVVRWIETAAPGGVEPEHPAPTLTLTKGASSDAATSSSPTGTTATSTKSDDSAKTLAIVGIVLGGLALVVAAGSFVRRRPAGMPRR